MLCFLCSSQQQWVETRLKWWSREFCGEFLCRLYRKPQSCSLYLLSPLWIEVNIWMERLKHTCSTRVDSHASLMKQLQLYITGNLKGRGSGRELLMDAIIDWTVWCTSNGITGIMLSHLCDSLLDHTQLCEFGSFQSAWVGVSLRIDYCRCSRAWSIAHPAFNITFHVFCHEREKRLSVNISPLLT